MARSNLDRYIQACDYPGALDEAKVEESLRAYLAALGVKGDGVGGVIWCR